MTIFRRISKLLAAPMAAVMFLVSVPIGAASAGLIPTDRVVERGAVEADRAAKRTRNLLQRDDVRAQLIGLGVDPAMAVSRAAGLSDTEIRDIAGRLDQLPAGQDVFGAVLGTALIIFLILLITDILGLTDVYPFVRR